MLIVLVLLAAPVAFAGTAAADPIPDDVWTCIPESPCCGSLVCKPEPEPCRVGYYYVC